MHVAKMNVQGTSLVGLYIVALDNIVFVSPEVGDEDKKLLGSIFQAEVVELTIAGTGLIGAFMATNGEKFIVPHILFDHEKAILDALNVPYEIIHTKQTCLGNNVLASKKGVLVSSVFSEEEKDAIAQAFDLPCQRVDLNDEATTIGSYVVSNDKYGVASYEFSDEQLEMIESFLGIALQTGTVNLGTTQIRSGLVTNNNGFIIGQASGGPEIVHADSALGFLGDDN